MRYGLLLGSLDLGPPQVLSCQQCRQCAARGGFSFRREGRLLDYTEIRDAETWELFARDFLADQGFVIEHPPGRGADQGSDFLVVEQLKGKIRTEKFIWLVSCKYFTKSRKAVGLSDEVSITDRLRQHHADGFVGFYSTLASSSLVEKLKSLEKSKEIRAFEIYDGKKIEAQFMNLGFTKLSLRYFPESYGKMRPIQRIFEDYIGLECEVCGRDILKDLRPESNDVIVAWSYGRGDSNLMLHSHLVCKGPCDHELREFLRRQDKGTLWNDLGNGHNPYVFYRSIIEYMNILHSQSPRFSDEAHGEMKRIFHAIAQRTLREITDAEAGRLFRPPRFAATNPRPEPSSD